MKQILQHLKTGVIELADVPCPVVRPSHLLIQTTRSLISPGTERMLVEFGRGGLIAKARSQPEKVRQVLDKIKTDGLLPTLEAVFSRLEEPLPLGYCNVGRIVEVGMGVEGFSRGDRVASNGPHAEMVCVPVTLAARVPDGVDDEAAAFTVLGSVALHGVRLLQPTLGESFVVIGLGLVGMMAVQLLRAHGCHVLGVDTNPERCELARTFGCQAVSPSEGTDPVSSAGRLSHGRGVDGVLIAAATKSNEPIRQAAQMCRKRGRIVSTGNVGMDLQRPILYEKEITLQVSCSYGPGRYDPTYEERSRDYPLPYVRWTVARNFEAVLDALSTGSVEVGPLTSRQIAHAEAAEAYDAIVKDTDVLGIVLTYPDRAPPADRAITLRKTVEHRFETGATAPTQPVVGVIGAGNFARLVLLPAIKAAGAKIQAVASVGGVTALHAGRKFEADEATSDYHRILHTPDMNTVFIATRHNTHAEIAADALEAGKHVFVEKPLAINEEGLERICAAHVAHPELQLMVGFNRRFAPHTVAVKKLLTSRLTPIAITMLINAGKLPVDHWQHDPAVGGSRIIGEACHFIDLLMYLVGHPITFLQAVAFGSDTAGTSDDTVSISMTYADGSIGTVHYWANGSKAYPKEQVTIFSEGRVLSIENWRRLRAVGWSGVPRMRMRQDKGHKAEVAAFLKRVTAGGEPLIPFQELEMVTRASFAAKENAKMLKR